LEKEAKMNLDYWIICAILRQLQQLMHRETELREQLVHLDVVERLAVEYV
jgi:hypothetical protein